MIDTKDRSLREMSDSLRIGTAVSAADLLTEEDIEELRTLISLSNREGQERIDRSMSDPAMFGRYLLLVETGFINGYYLVNGNIAYTGWNPKAAWAVAKRDRLKELEGISEKERNRQRRSDRLIAIATGFGGVVLGWVLSSVHF